MEIKGLGNKLTFKTPNVSCFMNFETKIGDFKSNEKDISTNFAYNQYKGEINEFRWDINKKILAFSAKEGTMGSRFTSTHPMQDSLTFYCKKAEYNMVSSIIKMEGVEEILIADSRIIPDGGKVNIFPEAKMETLKNATIEGDTANMYHVIEKATLDVNGFSSSNIHCARPNLFLGSSFGKGMMAAGVEGSTLSPWLSYNPLFNT